MYLGIIANPSSGKDIRRLVAYATVIDNNEKSNIVKRIVLAAQETGVNRIAIMPDTFFMGKTVIESLQRENNLKADVHILDMLMRANAEDTVEAAAILEKEGADCVIVLGGDGTSRAAAKSLKNTMLLPISTGTNNVYPDMTEGTIAGMAASAAMRLGYICCLKDKRIEIFSEGKLLDIALVDAVVSTDEFIGARAIWKTENIQLVITARAHPAAIGFSSLIGAWKCVRETDDYGMMTWSDISAPTILVPISAGIVSKIRVHSPKILPLNKDYHYTAANNCTVALDGERELMIRKGQALDFRITRNGPWRVKVQRALEMAQEQKLFIQ